MVLDPIARTTEVLFGLIMALTFTNTLSVATAGREEVRTLLFATIGCNIAWGLVDAVTFLLSTLTERGRDLLTIQSVQLAASRKEAYGVISASVPPVVASTFTTGDFERMRQALGRIDDLPPAPALTRTDWAGAAAVFLLVFLSTFPVVIPFVVFSEVRLALRISNVVAIVMLFACGYQLGAHGGQHPWRTGLGVMSVGIVLVAIAIALGG